MKKLRNKSIRPIAMGLALSLAALTSTQVMAETPKDQLIIGTSLAQVLSLDPQQATEDKANEIMSNLYDRLVASDPNQPAELKGQLAESWVIDDKGITFTLKDAKFSSGNQVTADDVVYSMVRLFKLNQAAAAVFKAIGYNADNIESLVSAIDAKTFRIALTDKVSADLLMYRLAMACSSVVDSVEVKKHVQGDDYGNAWLRTHSAGSGPFTLARWTPNEVVMLQANDSYVGGKPALKRVVMRHAPESQTGRLMLEKGDIDIANAMGSTDIGYFTDKPGFEIQRIKTGGFYVLAMNAGNQYMKNPLVREAIAYGIDYQGMEKSILGPYGSVRKVPVPDYFPNALPDPDWNFNIEKAKELLKQAGYPDGFSLTLKTIAQTPRIDMATALQASLGKIGIKVSIQQGNGSEIVAAHRARNFDLVLPQASAFMPNSLGAMQNFVINPDNSLAANNAGDYAWRSDWDIPELHAMNLKAAVEPDAAKRAQIVEDMQRKFIEMKPALLPMFQRYEPIVLSSRVRGYIGSPTQMTRLENVRKN
jgi:peptide/nickel transport system substrate-binding protein